MEIYGYARVSSKNQNLDRQIKRLLEYGVCEKNILVDKESGKDFSRKQYNLLVGTPTSASLLRPGDLLVITSLYRFGRNYTEIQSEWRKITHDMKVNVAVLDVPLLSFNGEEKTLDMQFAYNLVFQILSYVAETERLNIKKRQREGIDAALAAGKHYGRPLVKYPKDWDRIYHELEDGGMQISDVLDKYKLSRTTLYRMRKRYKEEQVKNN